MKNVSEEAFLADVSAICWEQTLTETDDINVLVNHWSSLLFLIIDKHAPIRGMRVSEKYCPWINQNLKNLMRSRDNLKKQQLQVSHHSLWSHIDKSAIRSTLLMSS